MALTVYYSIICLKNRDKIPEKSAASRSTAFKTLTCKKPMSFMSRKEFFILCEEGNIKMYFGFNSIRNRKYWTTKWLTFLYPSLFLQRFSSAADRPKIYLHYSQPHCIMTPWVHNYPKLPVPKEILHSHKLHLSFTVETERSPACLCNYHLLTKTENGT